MYIGSPIMASIQAFNRVSMKPIRMTTTNAIWRRILLFSAIAVLAVWANYEAAKAMDILVINKAEDQIGGKLFDSVMGKDKAITVLTEASEFVQKLLYSNMQNPRKSVKKVILCIDDYTSGNAVSERNVIHVSHKYIGEYFGDVEKEIRGLMYREMGRVWLWDGGAEAPRRLVEGMAEYVRLSAGLSSESDLWVESDNKTEDRWDAGGTKTALYLQYCESLKSGFVADLNAEMKKGWNEDMFEVLLGKVAARVWSTYKTSSLLQSYVNEGRDSPPRCACQS
eukprot:Gb_07741 [translate_table: standard]